MARILLADDSGIVLSLHSYILENAGHDCAGVNNGYMALEALMRESFDMVVTDVNMPRMDGYELTRRIRTLDDYKKVPIIIISTEQEAKSKAKGLAAGADVYIVKPTDPAALVVYVNMLLAAG